MSYALRCLFERLADACEANPLYHQRFGRGFRPSALPVFLHHQGNVSDDEARRKVAEWRELHPELVEAGKRFALADLLDGSKSPTFLTTPTVPDEGTAFVRERFATMRPCPIKFEDLTCAEAANPWARIEEMRKSVMAVSWAEEEQKTLAHLLARIPDGEVRCDPHVLTGLYAMNCRIVASGHSHAIEALGKPNRDTTPEESKAIQHVLDHGFRRSVWT